LRACCANALLALLVLLLAATPAQGLGTGADPAGSGAQPDLAQLINGVRHSGCKAHPGPVAALQMNDSLAQAARLMSKGVELAPALKQSHYRANRSVMLVLRGYDAPGALAGVLRGSYCGQVLSPELKEVGAFQQRGALWLILAAPFAPPAPDSATAVALQVLELVNQARGQPRVCGTQRFAGSASLRLNPLLGAAALNHARDMARHDFFDHTGSDGSTPAVRLDRTGYSWRAVGENIASGQNTPVDAVAGWLRSPGHCANLMAPQFSEMGLAFAVNTDASQGIYWVQVFASAR
jgi:uncharacterized protein YkwD